LRLSGGRRNAACNQPKGNRMQVSEIRERMKVIGSDKQPVGTVDKVEGERIKLARNDPQSDGQHHYIPTEWVDSIDGNQVCLRQKAQDARMQWQS
jgi:hypothetical protein